MPVRVVVVDVLCRTSCWDVLVVPVVTFPKASGPPVTLAVLAAVVPVPLSETGEPVTVTLAVMLTVPL